jgi:hypothetical protein
MKMHPISQKTARRNLKALLRIACYGDLDANARLKSVDSYGWFDEPGSVQTAREAIDPPKAPRKKSS